MKRCIVVYGNIASGKTTLCKSLHASLPGYELICIDNYRVNLAWRNDLDKYEKENVANARYMRDLHQFDRGILETTACSKLWVETLNYFNLKDTELVYIRVKCPINTCLARCDDRDIERKIEKVPIPMPPRASKDTRKSMEYIARNQSTITPNLVLDSSTQTASEMLLSALNLTKQLCWL